LASNSPYIGLFGTGSASLRAFKDLSKDMAAAQHRRDGWDRPRLWWHGHRPAGRDSAVVAYNVFKAW